MSDSWTIRNAASDTVSGDALASLAADLELDVEASVAGLAGRARRRRRRPERGSAARRGPRRRAGRRGSPAARGSPRGWRPRSSRARRARVRLPSSSSAAVAAWTLIVVSVCATTSCRSRAIRIRSCSTRRSRFLFARALGELEPLAQHRDVRLPGAMGLGGEQRDRDEQHVAERLAARRAFPAAARRRGPPRRRRRPRPALGSARPAGQRERVERDPGRQHGGGPAAGIDVQQDQRQRAGDRERPPGRAPARGQRRGRGQPEPQRERPRAVAAVEDAADRDHPRRPPAARPRPETAQTPAHEPNLAPTAWPGRYSRRSRRIPPRGPCSRRAPGDDPGR